MRLRSLLLLAVTLPTGAIARADDFSFTLNGGVGNLIQGTGTLSGDLVDPANPSGGYRITGITGTGITGLIAPGGYNGNDNLFFPTAVSNFDTNGLGFYDQNNSGVYEVQLFGNGGQYFAAVSELFTTSPFAVTVPVNFTLSSSATPEPSSLALLGTGALALAGVLRRRLGRA